MQHDRPVEEWNHRLGYAAGERLDAGAEASRHDDGFHAVARFALILALALENHWHFPAKKARHWRMIVGSSGYSIAFILSGDTTS